MMNVLEGVVGQNGDGCRKRHADGPTTARRGDVARGLCACGGKDTPVVGRVAVACSPLRIGARRNDFGGLSLDKTKNSALRAGMRSTHRSRTGRLSSVTP